jgi:hypothetical protein
VLLNIGAGGFDGGTLSGPERVVKDWRLAGAGSGEETRAYDGASDSAPRQGAAPRTIRDIRLRFRFIVRSLSIAELFIQNGFAVTALRPVSAPTGAPGQDRRDHGKSGPVGT